jgi:hypothetical protein
VPTITTACARKGSGASSSLSSAVSRFFFFFFFFYFFFFSAGRSGFFVIRRVVPFAQEGLRVFGPPAPVEALDAPRRAVQLDRLRGRSRVQSRALVQPVDVLGHDGHRERLRFTGEGLDRDVRVVRRQTPHLVEHLPVQEPAPSRVLAERAYSAVLFRVVRLPDGKQSVQRRRRADADAVRVDVGGAGDGFPERRHA